jgi:hypothetical protein
VIPDISTNLAVRLVLHDCLGSRSHATATFDDLAHPTFDDVATCSGCARPMRFMPEH